MAEKIEGEEKMERNTKKKKEKLQEAGITLVALVVTIIVLLILAAISMGLVLGQNGIIQRAKDAVGKWEKASNDEIAAMDGTDIYFAEFKNRDAEIAKLTEYFQKDWDTIWDDDNEIFKDVEPIIDASTSLKMIYEDSANIAEYNGDYYIIDFDSEPTTVTYEVPSIDDIFAAWYEEDDNRVLVLSHDRKSIDYDKMEISYGNVKNQGEYDSPVWNRYGQNKVKILNEIKPKTMYEWFGMYGNYYGTFEDIENIENINTSNVTNMSYLFYNNEYITYLDLSSFDTKNVKDMSYMFCCYDDWCSYLEEIDGLDKWDTRNVTNMSGMFDGCSYLESIDVSNFNTSKVTNMQSMFSKCNSLNNLDVSNFDTHNVTDFSEMFNNCYYLTTLDVSNFNTTNAENMNSMFMYCGTLSTLDTSNFDMSKVNDCSDMFACCYGLTNIYYPNTAKRIDYGTFEECTGLSSIYIPASVETIQGEHQWGWFPTPFKYCNSSTVIYCGAPSAPSGWGQKWNYYDNNNALTVKYGYTREQYEAEINGD